MDFFTQDPATAVMGGFLGGCLISFLVVLFFSVYQWKKQLGKEYYALNGFHRFFIVLSVIPLTLLCYRGSNHRIKFYGKINEKTKGLAEIYVHNFRIIFLIVVIEFIVIWMTLGVIIRSR